MPAAGLRNDDRFTLGYTWRRPTPKHQLRFGAKIIAIEVEIEAVDVDARFLADARAEAAVGILKLDDAGPEWLAASNRRFPRQHQRIIGVIQQIDRTVRKLAVNPTTPPPSGPKRLAAARKVLMSARRNR